MSAEEYAQLPDDDVRTDLVRGRVVRGSWVDVYYPDGSVRRLRGEDTLDGGALLPDLDIRVAQLFTKL